MRSTALLALTAFAAGCLATALALPLTLSGSAAPQGGTPPTPRPDEELEQDPADRTPGLRAYTERRRAELSEGLVGAWQITEFRQGARGVPADDLIGAMIVTPQHLSIVLHARQQREYTQIFDLFVQAGVHRWRIDEFDRLQTSTILAHSNLSGEMLIENPFTPREFDIELMGDLANLIRPDGNRIVLQRMIGEHFPEQTLELIRAARSGRPVDTR
jgi:hypothetical protein